MHKCGMAHDAEEVRFCQTRNPTTKEIDASPQVSQGRAVCALQTSFYEKGIEGASTSCEMFAHLQSNPQELGARKMQTLRQNIPQ